MRGFPFTNLLGFFLFCFTTSLAFLTKFSISADTLTASQILTTNQTLESASGTFVLGFFPVTNSNSSYLGIWYNINIDDKTVVWVANRDNPLQNSTGFLKIGDNGNIVLLNSSDQNPNSNNPVWSSNQTTATNPVVQLLETGNLVLREASVNDPKKYLWQSFDYPTDTLLPGKKMGWNFDTNTEKYITSWKNTGEDPSTGDYSFKLDYHGLPEIFLRIDQNITYRSGPWNGERFSGVPEMEPNTDSIVFCFSSDEHGVYYSFSIGNRSIFSRLLVSSVGELQRLTWVPSSRTWTKFWYEPKDQCDYYKMCGPYGICDSNASPICECLRGFSPKNQQAWSLRDGSDGCVRDTDLDCGSDKFLHLENVKLPETTSVFVNRTMSLAECGDLCHRNCSCTAYANIYITNGGTSCVMWIGELIDMRRYPEGGQDLYVRLAASDVESTSNANTRRKVAVALIISASMIVLLLCIIFYFYKKYTGARKRKNTADSGHRDQNEDQASPIFDIDTILAATNSFSIENKIGEGGFGPVYRGKLAQGQEIAVKRLSKTSKQGIDEFMNEVGLVAKLQHRNLVSVLGGCTHGNERMLVYEYMPNGSLNHFIFGPTQGKILQWRKRYEIIMGIARGLLYLHQDSKLTIIHRDLKTSNILLDNELNPKISDFGVSHILEGDHSAVTMNKIVGTIGYMSPEYAVNGLLSLKSDVFSFGVMVLEILSGIRNNHFNHPDYPHNLLGQAWILWKEGRAVEFMDVNLDLTSIPFELLRCLQVGLLCVQKFPEDRPDMSSVVFMLGNESIALAQPKKPDFFGEEIGFHEYSEKDYFSNNAMTITLLEARN